MTVANSHKLFCRLFGAPAWRCGASYCSDSLGYRPDFTVQPHDLEDCVLENLAHPMGLWHPERPKAVCHEQTLAAWRLGYRITRIDLQRAWEEGRKRRLISF